MLVMMHKFFIFSLNQSLYPKDLQIPYYGAAGTDQVMEYVRFFGKRSIIEVHSHTKTYLQSLCYVLQPLGRLCASLAYVAQG